MNFIKCWWMYLSSSICFNLSARSLVDKSIVLGELLGSAVVENKDPVDFVRFKPRGEHAAKPTADLLSFIVPLLFWDSSMRRGTQGTRGGSGGGLPANIMICFTSIWNKYHTCTTINSLVETIHIFMP